MSGVAPSLEAKLAFLSLSTSYPERVHRVERIETHMSWLFLTEAHVYKLKKPVRAEGLDFTLPASRRFFCEEELRLNRRLAPDVYLDIVPLTIENGEHFQLAGNGKAVEWLVKMLRLPAWRMLDVAILRECASARDASRIAAVLTAFYRTIPSERIAPRAYLDRFKRQIEANHAQLVQLVYRLPRKQVDAVSGVQAAVLSQSAELLAARARAGCIVEGHGDLRPEHVCLLPQITIIDCLEFSRELRVLDKADEVGFLALECERLGAPEIGESLLHAYFQRAGDRPAAALVHFYQSCRASTRAVIAIRHLQEERFRPSAVWRDTALAYLQLAMRHIAQCH